MTGSSVKISEARMEGISYVLAFLALLAVIPLGLLTVLLSGLLIYLLVEFGADALKRIGILPSVGRIILVLIIATVFISLITIGVIALVSRLTQGPDGLGTLLRTMADALEGVRDHLPPWVEAMLPFSFEDWRDVFTEWLREHATQLSVVGRDAGMFLTHLIVGMVIGGLLACGSATKVASRPLAIALKNRAAFLLRAFHRIVFSQIRISALNTTMTAVFLLGIMPAAGTPLPMSKTLVAVTFIVGLLPIIGNLISNTVITLVALSVSPLAAVGALAFLIFIHKLEYFVNARIVGGRINAHAWEILMAMVVMEAAFGIPGLVAAPIYYACLKDELSARGLV